MRLPSHSLPKQVHKKTRSVKHKDSAAKRARKEQKKVKAEAMEVDTPENATAIARGTQSEMDREEARLQRKKANAHRVAYKHIKKIR